ncbi:glycosyltransferase 87 family protein [Gemmata sp. JC717]|uniref:glycosyltransferase 87 family protein n=1 Tax=Gemmata algarum TaxID=2975278 RepID=UPI0021BB943C|nr:glycosyltransferase 87 family protein [Gemmata algarum]MDY3555175.1 glycosyltransferase 87 family protein [Gemmata algarum]
MPPDFPSPAPHWRVRAAWAVWLLVLAGLLTRGAVAPHRNNCFRDHYRSGGVNWLAGTDLYGTTADTCRYSPAVHVALVPFSALPEYWGGLAWRAAGAATLLAALGWWLRAVCPPDLSPKARAWVLLAALPLCLGSLNNGQSNVFMAAALLAGTAAAARGRWWVAAAAVAAACFFKIYPIAVGLLFVAMYPRRFGPRFALALAAGLLLPFLAQEPEYVARQYERWLGNLRADDRSAWVLDEAYRDAWLLVRRAGLPLSHAAYQWVTVAAAAAVGGLCLLARWRGVPDRTALNRAFGLGCCWMTAFGPATESPTYILLGPTLAWLLVESRRGGPAPWARGPVVLAAVLFFGTCVAVTTPPYGRLVLRTGTQPAAALVLLAVLAAMTLKRPAAAVAPAAGPFVPPVRRAA